MEKNCDNIELKQKDFLARIEAYKHDERILRNKHKLYVEPIMADPKSSRPKLIIKILSKLLKMQGVIIFNYYEDLKQ